MYLFNFSNNFVPSINLLHTIRANIPAIFHRDEEYILQFSHLLNNVGIHNDKKRYVYKDN